MAVHFPSSARAKAERIAETFRWRREQAASWLGLEPAGRADVHLVADHDAMARLAPGAPRWAVAVTRADGTVVFRLDLVDRSPSSSLDLALKHETVHFVLRMARVRLPRWFEEGLCVHYAGVAYLEMDTTVERVAAAGRLPRFSEADALFERGEREAALGYRLGQRVAAAYVRRFGDGAVRRLVRALAGRTAFPDAFAEATGEELDRFERSWREEVTPALPFWLFVIVENLDVALLSFGAVLVALGYLRWRLRRARELTSLGGGEAAP